MPYITLNTATTLTGLSKRTLWRRVADAHIRTQVGAEQGEPARLLIDDVLAISRLKLSPEDYELLLDADAGHAEAQCDLGLEFLMQALPAEAVHWLTLAAQQDYPEAMHQLGRCYIAGNGVAPDEAQGIAWIARAAGLGHSTARHMAQYLMDPTRERLEPAALEAKLDAIEQKVVLAALHETADPA